MGLVRKCNRVHSVRHPNKLKSLISLAIVVAACCPTLASEPGSKGLFVLGDDQSREHRTTRPDSRNLLSEPGCISPTWLCSASPDLQHRISDTLYSAVKTGQCLRLLSTLGLWRCGKSLVPDDLEQLVTNGTCTSECSAQTEHCSAAAPSPALVPAPAPSTHPCLPPSLKVELLKIFRHVATKNNTGNTIFQHNHCCCVAGAFQCSAFAATMQIQICDQSPLAVTAAQLQIAIASSLAGTPAEDVHVQPSRVSQPLSVPCLPPASSPAVNNNQRHLLALPSSGLTQPELDNALMRESLAWTLQQRLMLQEAPLLNTDLIATGRSLRQSTDPADVFAERIQQVLTLFAFLCSVFMIIILNLTRFPFLRDLGSEYV